MSAASPDHAGDEPQSTALIGRAVRAGFVAVVILGLAVLPFRTSDQQITIASNAALLLVYLGLIELHRRLVPQGPVPLVALLVYFASIQPVALLLATSLQGECDYFTLFGWRSYHYLSASVAAARVGCFGAAIVGAICVGIIRAPKRPAFGTTLLSLPSRVVDALQILGVGAALYRVLQIFLGPESSSPMHWALRIAAGALWPLVLFIGVGLRSGSKLARPALLIIAATAALQTVAGNRTWALEPFVFIGLAWVAVSRVSLKRFVPLVVAGSAMLAVVMFVGDRMRQDAGGRSGEDALRRVDEIAAGRSGERFETATASDFQESTIKRFLHASSHAIVTQVPEAMEHEPAGLTKLPADLADEVMPKFYFTGRTRERELRAWFLNELGFRVSWSTSVELALDGDGWYRGGAWGVVLVGFIIGVVLQSVERMLCWNIARAPEWIIALIGIGANVFFIEGRDIVTGVRHIVLTLPIFVAAVLFLRLVSSKRPTTTDATTASLESPAPT